MNAWHCTGNENENTKITKIKDRELFGNSTAQSLVMVHVQKINNK